MSRYRFLEHTTDAEIEAYGANIERAFENAGTALEDTMVDINRIENKIEEEITVRAKDKKALLYSWLEALIIKQDVEGMLYSKFQCKISEENGVYKLVAKVEGEGFDKTKHEQKTAIKAPTYHEMKINELSEGVILKFVLDL